MLPKFDWKDVAKIVLALVASGFIWTVDNQMALLSLAAMGIVWVVKFYTLRSGKQVGKFALTMVLLVLSIGFAVLFQGVTVPSFPIFDASDALSILNSVFAYAGAWLLAGKEVFAVATGLYNILLADVLKKLEPVPAGLKLPRRK